MKALSLHQPHAIAIGLGLKKYETRGWQLRAEEIGVPVVIHAAKKVFREKDYEWEYFKEVRSRLSEAGVPLHKLDYGKAVCICVFSACQHTRFVRGQIGLPEFWGDFRDVGDDGRDRFAFKICQVKLIPEAERPEIVGRQGFFNVPDDLGLWWSE
jgi:hypothetical protein